MQVVVSEKDGIFICRVEGEIDINTAVQLKKAFDKLIREKRDKIVISMEKVSYIDSSGLATLVELLKNFRKYGARMKLAGLTAKVKSLFEITKLEKLFDILEKEEEAIKAF
ncbi:MAG: STAS domain-containing protein [Candidatus Omnitrophica bacterium]|nr:STAS domain-containing protein [Candidatus Omnitrophota bacterium]